jgi:hypothetical protein
LVLLGARKFKIASGDVAKFTFGLEIGYGQSVGCQKCCRAYINVKLVGTKHAVK